MTEDIQRRVAVLGSPIAHSQSPALHRAAYRRLGLPWQYDAVDITADSLAEFVRTRDDSWQGLSLTMPLKQAVLPLLASRDALAELTDAANTLLFDRGATDGGVALRGFNTDVAGIVRALAAAGVDSARFALILGGGATAASALAAAAELGAERVQVAVRSRERSAWLEPIAHSLGLTVAFSPLGTADRTLDVPDLVISTLPGDADPGVLFTDSTRRSSTLLDVAYDPWPSRLAVEWNAVGGRVVSGLAMLVHQALLQVRVFVSGDPLLALPDEELVLADMRAAVGLNADGSAVVPESDDEVSPREDAPVVVELEVAAVEESADEAADDEADEHETAADDNGGASEHDIAGDESADDAGDEESAEVAAEPIDTGADADEVEAEATPVEHLDPTTVDSELIDVEKSGAAPADPPEPVEIEHIEGELIDDGEQPASGVEMIELMGVSVEGDPIEGEVEDDDETTDNADVDDDVIDTPLLIDDEPSDDVAVDSSASPASAQSKARSRSPQARSRRTSR